MILNGKVISFSQKENSFQVAVVELGELLTPFKTPEGEDLKQGTKIRVVGSDIPEIGCEFSFEGDFEKKSSQNGKQFKSSFKITNVIEVVGSIDVEALLKTFKGIGEKGASKIFKAFSDKKEFVANPIDYITKNIDTREFEDRLAKEGAKSYISILQTVVSKSIDDKDIQKLAKLGFSQRQITTMVRLNGEEKRIIDNFKENPYNFVLKGEIEFSLIDKIALSVLKIDLKDHRRVSSCIKYIIDSLQISGNTFFEVSSLFKKFEKMSQLDDISEFKNTINKMIKDKVLWLKVNRKTKQKFIGLTSSLMKENFIRKELLRLSKINKSIFDTLAMSRARGLSPEQETAIRVLIDNNVSVLRGGPGSGKTYTLGKYIEYLRDLPDCNAAFKDLDYVLLAPTGRAAKRMAEISGESSFTIHSFLGIKPGDTKTKPAFQPKVVIVDESSMLDLDVMYLLLSSLNSDVRIVFIGDTNQLQSVGAGNILGDIISSKKIPVAFLSKVHRQAEVSFINLNANAILKGESKLNIGNDFEYIKVKDPKEAQKELLLQLKKAKSIYGMNNFCVLTPLRRYKPTSTEIINPVAQKLLNENKDGSPELVYFDKTFRVGDKVMVTKNSDVASNGDVGIVLSIDEKEQSLLVDLGYKLPTLILKSDLESLDLAYAITIHKSQGSEYDCAIVLIMDEHDALLQKNLIYTAITRAKKKCIIIGQDSAIKKSIIGKQPKRKTLLKDLLKESQ